MASAGGTTSHKTRENMNLVGQFQEREIILFTTCSLKLAPENIDSSHPDSRVNKKRRTAMKRAKLGMQ